MAELNMQDAYLLEKVADPSSVEYQYLLTLLMTDPTDDRTTAARLRSKQDFKYTLPFKGEPEDEAYVKDITPFNFAERGEYRNGAAALTLVLAELVDLVGQATGKNRTVPVIVATGENHSLMATLGSAGGVSSVLKITEPDDLVRDCLLYMPDTLIFDHASVCAPVDEVLNMAYLAGIMVVDGVFPYHVAAIRGWDCVAGVGHWSYTHHGDYLTIGPNDDSSKLVQYKKTDYMKFIDPKRWSGNSRKYGYELRVIRNGLVSYRAVYLGEAVVEFEKENLAFSLPICSSDDMVLVSVNRELAAGIYASDSNNAQELARLNRDYAIEVRKDLFVSCVDFLIAKDRGADIVGDAVAYITQHNYVDLVDGVRIVRCASLAYADALCVAMVCSLTAFSLRYRLTTESLHDINRHVQAAGMKHNAPYGALGRLAWYMYTYVSDAVNKVYVRSASSAREMLFGSDYIPGVCYDLYFTTHYSPDLDWYEPSTLVLEETKGQLEVDGKTDDAITRFLADAQKTSTATALRETTQSVAVIKPLVRTKYQHKRDNYPAVTIQHVYDQAFPGNSVAHIQNAAELKRVKDVDVVTEFFGKVEMNKDVAARELLHADAPVRTAALPITRTSLLDAITASAKRNFNPPDLQMQNDPWEYAKYLVGKFINTCMDPGFTVSLGASYKKDPITFNVTDYLEWLATRDTNYRSALEAECPEDLMELNLERYDTIVKKRIKPKLSTSAQYELSQPQVIVSNSKKDTAPFTSIFRKMFERFEAALRPQFKSAGRMSDKDISDWLTEHRYALRAFECIEIDSSKYDKSQGLLARMIESLLLTELGLDPGVMEIFSDSYVGKVSSKTLGLMFVSSYQMKSGAPDTMLGNIIYNFISTVECVGSSNVKYMIAKGDDNLVWVATGVDKTSVVDRMSALFNLECKLVTDQVWYFSSGYVVPLEDSMVFAPDPLKMAELMGEIGQDPRTIAERYISFCDRVKSLTEDAAIPYVLQELVRSRMANDDIAVVQLVDAFASLAESFVMYRDTVPK